MIYRASNFYEKDREYFANQLAIKLKRKADKLEKRVVGKVIFEYWNTQHGPMIMASLEVE